MLEEESGSWKDLDGVEVVHEFLSGLVGATEAAELDMPHIVICQDSDTGAVSYEGPFPDGMAALVFAERESVVDQELNDGMPLRFTVAALYPGGHTLAG
ncbi:MAG: hypothetical protein JWQ74_1472 [Marmoricola sp.]|nr:hypothetical protein [Marmoricola sp.]